MAQVHIIGAGISGLAAATWLAEQHVAVTLYEAATAAGGRARSSTQPGLGECDHGLHLIDGNARELRRYLRRIDAPDALMPLPTPLPMPFASLMDYGTLVRSLLIPSGVLDAALPIESPLREEWLEPFSRLWLNAPATEIPTRAAARLVRSWLLPRYRQLFYVAAGLSTALIQPALRYLEDHGVGVYFGHALKSIAWDGLQPQSLKFARKQIVLDPDDIMVFATPPDISAALLPGLPIPAATHAAITYHFALEHTLPKGHSTTPTGPADLIRIEPGRISATLRVAGPQWHADRHFLAHSLWQALQRQHPALRAQPMPPYALHREKFAGHRPQEAALPAPNLPPRILLAGDWLDATRPATLEGAVQNGHHAAQRAMRLLPPRTARRQSPPPATA